jgi:8-oxo-dGTP diphosphatase
MGADFSAYPSFLEPLLQEWGTVSFERDMPADSLIGNVSMVPFVGDRCVLIDSKEWGWMLPGGTLEPDETWRQALERELLEEAGARIVSCEHLLSVRTAATHDNPYRPHLPFPVYYRVIFHGEVKLVAEPSNPPDGEEVIEVRLTDAQEARELMTLNQDPWYIDLIDLAVAQR